MTFIFPNLPKLSLWDIACGHTGQNAADLIPTNETRHKLAELVKDASEHMLWVEFARAGDDSGLFIEFMPAAPRAAVDAGWRRLNDVTVRREDWERYEKHCMQAAPNAVMHADIEQAGSTLAKPLAPHVSKMVELIANDEPIDWDYWAGKMPRWTANQAVRLMSALDPLKHRDLSFTRNETGGAAKEHATRMEMLAASHGMTEASPLEWLGWADSLNEPVHEGCRRAVTFAAKQAHTLKLVQEQADLWAHRQPARIYGAGFSEEMQKQTTLTRYLQYDTWTPEAATMLVCGLQAPIIDGQQCTEIPEKGAMGLDNCFIVGNQDPFHEAKRVLGIWRSQESPPAKVRPLDFIRWCQVRGFDTAWLRSVEEDAASREKEDMKAALGSGAVVIPSAPLLSAEWLAGHIAFSLVAIPDDERLSTIKKEVPAGDGVVRIELLTNDDRRLVHSICGKSLAGCSRAEFEAYRQKFDAEENRPEWSLTGEFRESAEMTKAQARWGEVVLAHKQQIAQWVSNGGRSLVTADRIATTDITRGFIRREDVKQYLDEYDLPWRDIQAKVAAVDRSRSAIGQPNILEADQARNSGPSVVITKRSIGTRSNPLKAVIEKAKSSAADPSDNHSVWAALVKLAQDANRPAPLLGYADAEGVKWDDNGTVRFFTKKNLVDRVRRANAR